MHIAESGSKSAFHFVNSNSLAKLGSGDRKVIKRHVARGTGRSKRATAHLKPRVGSWLRHDDEPYGQEITRQCKLPSLPSVDYNDGKSDPDLDSVGTNKDIKPGATLTFTSSLYALSSSPDITPGMLNRIYRGEYFFSASSCIPRPMWF